MQERKITNPLFSFPTFSFPLADTMIKGVLRNSGNGK